MAPVSRPPLIAFVSDVSARTQFILPNQAHIDSLPFDGIVVNIPASWSQMSPGYVATEADVREWLGPLTAFNQGRENYLAMEMDRPGALFDDAAWAQVVANWRVIGKVAAETGFKGILFDNEEYQGRWNNFPEEHTGADANRTLADAQAMASIRGQQLMEALAEVMPDAKLAMAHGPYLSVPATPGAPPAILLQAGGYDDQELTGPFFTGFLQGMGPRQSLIDAGELYALRTAAEFQQSFDYRDQILPGLIPWEVEPEVLNNWSDLVDQGHMIYTGTFPEGYTQTPETLVTTLLNAFDHSEGAVFLYNDTGQFDWLAPETIDAAWLAALTRAVALADHTQRGGSAADRQAGGSFADRLFGGAGSDRQSGFGGDDLIFGGRGNDLLYGGAGADTLTGGTGRDRLDGGRGDDRLTGGAGTDAFVLRSGGGADIVTDFNPLLDRIDMIGPAGSVVMQDTAGGVRLVYAGASLLLLGVDMAEASDLLMV